MATASPDSWLFGDAAVPDGATAAADRWPGDLDGARARAGRALAKRAVDLVGAGLLLLLTAPVLCLLAVLVKATSPGPAFFRQVRVGRSGKTFRIVKLRTMRADAEQQLGHDPSLRERYLSNHFKVPPEEDPRLTPLGRFLRRASLDELPQLLNVVAGHMSLVGPRPVVPAELALYGDVAPLYAQARPGITGYWQVEGRSTVTGTDRVQLDRYYLEHANLWLDLRILARTLPAVLRCRGAH